MTGWLARYAYLPPTCDQLERAEPERAAKTDADNDARHASIFLRVLRSKGSAVFKIKVRPGKPGRADPRAGQETNEGSGEHESGQKLKASHHGCIITSDERCRASPPR